MIICQFNLLYLYVQYANVRFRTNVVCTPIGFFGDVVQMRVGWGFLSAICVYRMGHFQPHSENAPVDSVISFRNNLMSQLPKCLPSIDRVCLKFLHKTRSMPNQ